MSTILQQLEALTNIRALVEKHFPGRDFRYVADKLLIAVHTERHQEVTFDEDTQAYVLRVLHACKVCEAEGDLTMIPLAHGQFYICAKCKHEIVSAKTLAALGS